MSASPSILLVDNGSLEPAATLSLRTIASRLEAQLGANVRPISLLHSSTVPADQLGGESAEILEPFLNREAAAGKNDFLIVPLFFGPSGALTDYLPKRIAALKQRHPSLRVRIAPPLGEADNTHDDRLAAILEDRIHEAEARSGENDPAAPVILVDHGSPVRAVTAVRDHVARQLRQRLGTARPVLAASMERRPGPEYAFNEPLLKDAFDRPGFGAGAVIVAQLFLSPGRHAGSNGDIAQICAAAKARHATLRPIITEPIGAHPDLITLLVERTRAGLVAPPL